MKNTPFEEIVEKVVDLVVNGKSNVNILTQLGDVAEYLASDDKHGEFDDEWKRDCFPLFADYNCRQLSKFRTAIGRRLKQEAYKNERTYLELFRIVAAFDLLYYGKKKYRPMEQKNRKLRFVWHYWELLGDEQYMPEALKVSCRQMASLDK